MLLEKEVIFGEDLETIFGKKIKHVGHEIILTDIKANGTVELPKKRGRKKQDS